ncbi:MAG: DUF6174 domain-containing protein [Pirellulales bacterium]
MIEREPRTPGPDESHDRAPSESVGRVRPAPLMLGVASGLAVVLVAVLAVAFLWRDNTPRLTESDYEAAVARWDANGPADYNLDLELAGNRPGKIHVEVRDGRAVHMTRDGVEPKQERTWYYWTVPGQLDTIGQELEMARDPAESFASPKATGMVIWAEFDPQFGYPVRYDRVVLGTNFEIHWKVTRFEPVSQESAGKK